MAETITEPTNPPTEEPTPRRNDYELFPRPTVGVHACVAGSCPAHKQAKVNQKENPPYDLSVNHNRP